MEIQLFRIYPRAVITLFKSKSKATKLIAKHSTLEIAKINNLLLPWFPKLSSNTQ